MKISVTSAAIVAGAISMDAVSAFSSPRVGPKFVRYASIYDLFYTFILILMTDTLTIFPKFSPIGLN